MENETTSKLQQLIDLEKQVYYLGTAQQLMSWDQQTMMPTGGEQARATAMGVLAGVIHKSITDPIIGNLLKDLNTPQQQQGLDLIGKAQVRETSRGYRYATILPTEFVTELSEASALGHSAWVNAKKERNFSLFAGHLKRLLTLKQREAELRCTAGLANSPYDAMLDEYEPGMTADQLTPLFDDIGAFLSGLIRQVAEHKKTHAKEIAANPLFKILADDKSTAPFAREAQRQLGLRVAADIGFDFARGRLDETAHPFCTGISSDTRLTTRYKDTNPLHALYAVIHEAGHGMYVQGLPAALEGTPAGEYRSLGVHESQSLIWENCVGHSLQFCDYLLPLLRESFPKRFDGVEAKHLYDYMNQVTPSLIRVDADDVTYILHVIIRFQLEKRLLENQLSIDELPSAWNALYEKYLGIRPSHDGEGVLQDVHWSSGSFGYFPTYALGNMLSVQLFKTVQKTHTDLLGGFSQGKFAPLLTWLRKNLHQHGCIYETNELLRLATGSTLTVEPFKAHLREKVHNVYGIKA